MKTTVFAVSALALVVSATPLYAENIAADVWADNWFALYVNGKLVKEDSVPITTERSFNAESFTFSATRPYVLGIVAKDFKENDTGLEYIGSNRQQMGDGGLIAQFKSGGNTIAVTDGDWKCLVVHHAPVDVSCAGLSNPKEGEGACASVSISEPAGWSEPGFDDSSWSAASVFTEAEVGPKDGYDRIAWDGAAKLIWGPNLKQDNTILCRLELD